MPRDRPFRPARREFGQHFLERTWADKLVAAIGPERNDTFVEIGPGRGALTRPLAARAGRVVAFEIDRDLAAELAEEFRESNVRVVQADFLALTPREVMRELSASAPPAGPVRAAGNLPYNVASPILFRLVQLHDKGLPIADATVMLQREVADRLLARPGTREYGVLSVLMQHRAAAERVLSLPPGAFRPAPRVHSSVVRLRFHAPDPAPADPAVFEGVTQAVFSRRRKTVANALLAYAGSATLAPAKALAEAGIEGTRRPETLHGAELVRLADVFARARAGG